MDERTETAIYRAKNPYRWVRRALLVAGILGVVSLTVLIAAYEFGRAGSTREGDTQTPRTDEGTLTTARGFDYTQTSQGRKVFRIRAEKSQQDRDNTARLETVILDVYRDDGQVYTVTSRRAQVDQETWHAELEGEVRVTGWGDLELEARALRLEQGGQQLVSVGAVEFRYPPGLVGRASGLRLDQRADTIHMTGGVHVRSTPGAEIPLRLDCERLVFLRREGIVRVLDDVYLRHGERELSTRALNVFLREDGRTLERVRALWEVRGSLRSADPFGAQSRVEIRSESLELEPGEKDPSFRHVRLKGGDSEAASIRVMDAAGLTRLFAGDFLELQIAGSELHRVEGFGEPLTLDEFLDFDEPFFLRRACAHHVIARFAPGGELDRLFLEQQVELQDLDRHLSGGTYASLDVSKGTLDIEGPSVELYDSRSELTAPHISYSRASGVLRAGTGVRAVLAETRAFAETPLGQGEGAVRIEAEELSRTENPVTFSFRGGVRAWRGANLLLAEQLRGDESSGELAASGGVKTLWVPPPSAQDAAQRIEVSAERLSYREGENLLIYSGSVEVQQEARTLRCRELAIELGEDSAAERMLCRGDVVIDDPPAGRRVKGDLAIYTVARKRIEVEGETVELLDRNQNLLTGRYLVYDLEAGNVRLLSRRPAEEESESR